MFGLDEKTLTAIKDCLRHYPDIKWVKIYGSRQKATIGVVLILIWLSVVPRIMQPTYWHHWIIYLPPIYLM